MNKSSKFALYLMFLIANSAIMTMEVEVPYIAQLPKEIRGVIYSFIVTQSDNPIEAIKSIQNLAQTDKKFYEEINNSENIKTVINLLHEQFKDDLFNKLKPHQATSKDLQIYFSILHKPFYDLDLYGDNIEPASHPEEIKEITVIFKEKYDKKYAKLLFAALLGFPNAIKWLRNNKYTRYDLGEIKNIIQHRKQELGKDYDFIIEKLDNALKKLRH